MKVTSSISIVPKTVQRLEMDDETYFGKGLPNYISNSLMGLINPDQGGSPTKFFYGFDDEAKYSAALELGSAVHALILEADKYNLAEVSKPTGMVGPIFDTVYKMMHREENPLEFNKALDLAVVYHNYYNGELTDKRRTTLIEKGKPYLDFLVEYKTPGMICLTPEVKLKLQGCVASVKANKIANTLLNPPKSDLFEIESYNEDVIICEAVVTVQDLDPEGAELELDSSITLSLKAKIDNWSIDFDNKVVTLNDLKTTGKGIQDFAGRTTTDSWTNKGKVVTEEIFVKGSFQSYHYHRQMYMYSLMLWQYCVETYSVSMEDGWVMNTNMIVVETNKPHRSQVFTVSNNWMQIGRAEMESLLGRIKWHKENGFDKLIEIEDGNNFAFIIQ